MHTKYENIVQTNSDEETIWEVHAWPRGLNYYLCILRL
jgi:hypothetical protein